MMRRTFEVEVRESRGRKRLSGTMVTEGRAASGGRREVFAPGSVSWPVEGVGVSVGHYAAVEIRAQAMRQRDGKITLSGDATDAVERAIEGGARYMSVEFVTIRERTTKGGVREILEAFVPRAALVRNPEYDTTAAEVRNRPQRADQRRARWL